MKAVAALMAVLIAPAAAWMPVAPSRVGVALEARGKGKASTADGERRKHVRERWAIQLPCVELFVA
jgi:hypothetical protein